MISDSPIVGFLAGESAGQVLRIPFDPVFLHALGHLAALRALGVDQEPAHLLVEAGCTAFPEADTARGPLNAGAA